MCCLVAPSCLINAPVNLMIATSSGGRFPTHTMPPHTAQCRVQTLHRLCSSAQGCFSSRSCCQQVVHHAEWLLPRATRAVCSASVAGLYPHQSRPFSRQHTAELCTTRPVSPWSWPSLQPATGAASLLRNSGRPAFAAGSRPQPRTGRPVPAWSSLVSSGALKRQRHHASVTECGLASCWAPSAGGQRRGLATGSNSGQHDRDVWLSQYWARYRVKRCVRPTAAAVAAAAAATVMGEGRTNGAGVAADTEDPCKGQELVKGATLVRTTAASPSLGLFAPRTDNDA